MVPWCQSFFALINILEHRLPQLSTKKSTSWMDGGYHGIHVSAHTHSQGPLLDHVNAPVSRQCVHSVYFVGSKSSKRAICVVSKYLLGRSWYRCTANAVNVAKYFKMGCCHHKPGNSGDILCVSKTWTRLGRL